MKTIGDQINLDLQVVVDTDKTSTIRELLDKDFNIIYFYPKDETPGCTVEACEFRDANHEIIVLGANLFGVSKDSIKSHKKFAKKHDLSFTLISDEELSLHKEFGTWVEKSMYGKKYMGTQRSTFILNKKGEILFVWGNVTPLGHSNEVLEKLKTLKI